MSNIYLVQPAFFFQCAFKQSGRGFDILGRSGFRSRHERVLYLLPHWPNSEGLGEMLVDHVNRVTQRPNNFGEVAPVRAHWSSKLELPIHEFAALVQDDWSAVNHWLYVQGGFETARAMRSCRP
jgi:hypothetical protein